MHFNTVASTLALASMASAFPALLQEASQSANLEKRLLGIGATFVPSQLIDVTGKHAYVAPSSSDLRGPW